eukprot:820430-Heterocapsa_arctica.AAC.1
MGRGARTRTSQILWSLCERSALDPQPLMHATLDHAPWRVICREVTPAKLPFDTLEPFPSMETRLPIFAVGFLLCPARRSDQSLPSK